MNNFTGGIGIGAGALAQVNSSNGRNPIPQRGGVNPNTACCLLGGYSGGKGFGGGHYDGLPCKHLADINAALDRFDAIVKNLRISLGIEIEG